MHKILTSAITVKPKTCWKRHAAAETPDKETRLLQPTAEKPKSELATNQTKLKQTRKSETEKLPIKPKLPKWPKKPKPENTGKSKKTTQEPPKFENAESLNEGKSEVVYKTTTCEKVFWPTAKFAMKAKLPSNLKKPKDKKWSEMNFTQLKTLVKNGAHFPKSH